jgi:glycosyltransferase involved in cell wall biosynthesis
VRLFYAAGGPADLAEAYSCFADGRPYPNDVCIPFGNQIVEACTRAGVPISMVSPKSDMASVRTEQVTIEPVRKRPATGWRYFAEEVRYSFELLKHARRHRAHIAVLDSGCVQYFLMALFQLAGIRVILVLHNTIWPAGFGRPGPKLIQRLDDLFFRHVPLAVIGVSPECIRQLETIAPRHKYFTQEIRAQFPWEYFANIPAPPPHGDRPFRVMFIGRVEEAKGVLDIVDMARIIEESNPGLVKWKICGNGSALGDLRHKISQYDLGSVVEATGWISLEELKSVYADSHASIVPTRSGFCEGMAMTAVEAILSGRPLVTNPIVPALEVLRAACEEAEPENVESHAQAVLRLALDKARWEQKCRACSELQRPFYDRQQSLMAAIYELLQPQNDVPSRGSPSDLINAKP